MKPLETSFERIETKYMVSKTDLHDLIEDLKDYLVEDDYPTSTISNIYFDTEDFQLIQDSLQDQHKKEKIRMRTYLCLLYTSPSPRDRTRSRMPSSA